LRQLQASTAQEASDSSFDEAAAARRSRYSLGLGFPQNLLAIANQTIE